MKPNEYKNSVAVFHKDTEGVTVDGVTRRIKAYTDNLMCVENTFETGAVGTMHSHPHTQLTYIISGRFRFTVDGKVYEVSAGDTLLKQNGVIHGCVAVEGGVMLDIFTPMREDFV
ncbi:MAG: cupin domain-containing protein [Clostridia bacterium]|nr:cupin domain-containing protein [Clostridia bacterium]